MRSETLGEARDDSRGIWCSWGKSQRHIELDESTAKRTIRDFL
jgi:hypothetical protein